MRALMLQAYGDMVVTELPDPTPGPDDVIVRTAFTGICGSDIHGYTGANGRRVPGQVMGHETSGTVESVGADVSPGLVGAHVTYNPVVVPPDQVKDFGENGTRAPGSYVIGVAPQHVAAFAQRVVVPARNLVPVPEDVPLRLGALVEPLAVALQATRRTMIASDRIALIIGGGPIGQSLVLALRDAGVEHVIVSEISESRRRLVSALGGIPVDPMDGSLAGHLERLDHPSIRLAFDCVGASSTLQDALDALQPGGVCSLVGMLQPQLSILAAALTTRERSIVGTFAYTTSTFAAAANLLPTQRTTLETLISEVVPLTDAPDAFRRLGAGEDVPGKILVRLTDD